MAGPPDIFGSPLLSGDLRALAQRGDVRRYRKGTLLIQEGDRGDSLYVILDGRLRAFAADSSGREITYAEHGAGEYVGEMSLDGGPRSASVLVIEPTTCAVVTRHTLETFIAERPSFAFELLAKLIRRARAATLNVKQLALHGVYGRLVLMLDGMAIAQEDGTREIERRPTHQEIANRLGCSREMVSRLMKDLERGQFVAIKGRGLQLLRRLPARW
jgi:CRP/FNR family cyclic AMP-dependent transcriptional regulator